MINNDLDLEHWRRQLAQCARVQVRDFLQPVAAERLHRCLTTQVPWSLAVEDADGPRTIAHDAYAAMPAQARLALYRDVALSAQSGAFCFVYDTYMMVEAYKEGRDPDLVLHRVLELFNSPDYIDFMQQLAGDPRIRRVSAQASRYTPGQFLRRHYDIHSGEGRLYAYVLNLSRRWEADWGGLLQFLDDDGSVGATFVPRWNSLTVFRVPAGHAVSLVAPWAQQERLAITGWLLS